jgi:hypothetical protein
MTHSAESRAEALYLDIFGIVAANSDFLQPEEGVDFILAEAFIGSIAATVVTAFLNGFFGDLGKEFYKKLRRRPFREGEIIETEPEVLITEIIKRMGVETLDPARLTHARVEIENTLRNLGVTEETSIRISLELVHAIERQRHER